MVTNTDNFQCIDVFLQTTTVKLRSSFIPWKTQGYKKPQTNTLNALTAQSVGAAVITTDDKVLSPLKQSIHSSSLACLVTSVFNLIIVISFIRLNCASFTLIRIYQQRSIQTNLADRNQRPISGTEGGLRMSTQHDTLIQTCEEN